MQVLRTPRLIALPADAAVVRYHTTDVIDCEVTYEFRSLAH
jgi:hypothetical protein